MGKPLRPETYVEGQTYGIIDRSTGFPISFGTVISEDLSDNYDVIELNPPNPGQVWDPDNRVYIDPVPTEEELAEKEAAEAEAQAKEADDIRIAELRKKVGPGKPGLTQAERDELNLIALARTVDTY